MLDKEYDAAHLHVLLNCPEVDPYIHPNNGVHTDFIKHIAYRPGQKVTLCNVYFVNGFKFHTKDWSVGKKTMNSGVCIKANDDPKDDSYYYGHIKKIVQLEYIGEPTKQLTLFKCDWFDHSPNRGVKVDAVNGIVEVRHRGRYTVYDPFIFAQNAIQVYYAPYPQNVRGKSDWWVVIRTKPRCTVDDRFSLEVAYQENSSVVNAITAGDDVGTLRNEGGGFDEVEQEQEQEEEDEEDEEDERGDEEQEDEDDDDQD